MRWEIKRFSEISVGELHDILKLRVDVFVVEQNCPYPEIDGKDRHPDVFHIVGKNKNGNGSVVAYMRILPPGLSYKQVSLGRVVVEKESRGKGISDKMLGYALDKISRTWPHEDIQIGAQVYLRKFYESLGFEASSENYLEDGIPHLDMIRKGDLKIS